MIPRKAATLALAAFAWWTAQPAWAQAAEVTSCPSIRQPEKIALQYKLTFDQHHIDFVEVRQLTSIDIPAGQWPLANDLTLSEDSPKYRNAMRCLLHATAAPKKFGKWHPEWHDVSQATEQQRRPRGLERERGPAGVDRTGPGHSGLDRPAEAAHAPQPS